MVGQKWSQSQHYSVYKDPQAPINFRTAGSTDVWIHPLGNWRFFLLLLVCYFALAPLHLLVNGRVPDVLGVAREWPGRLLACSPAALSLEETDSIQIQAASQCTQVKIIAILSTTSNQWTLMGVSWNQFIHATLWTWGLRVYFTDSLWSQSDHTHSSGGWDKSRHWCFSTRLLNYDSNPLICSVTIWWLSVKVWPLSYIYFFL